MIVIAGSSAGRDDYTAARGRRDRHPGGARRGGQARHPVVLGAAEGTPVLGAPGYPVSAALTFDIFAAPLLARLEGAAYRPTGRGPARLARKLASAMGVDDWIRVRLGRVRGELVATPLPRARECSHPWCGPTAAGGSAPLEGHHAGEEVEAAAPRRGEIDAPSWSRAPTTSCWTSPPRRSGSAIRASRWPRPTSALLAA